MRNKILTGILMGMMLLSVSNAQQRRGNFDPSKMNMEITITGKVFNDETKGPVEYANVMIVSKRDSSKVYGNVTDENGIFKIEKVRPGRYSLDVQFMGYAKKHVDQIMVRPNAKTFDTGEIYLTPELVNMDEVIVEADRVAVAFQIDKKIISVGSQAVSASGTAVDVLENIPSVNVDIEGNVSLRGSENFTVLVDGRPTILEPNEILQQLPASKIENIEIITNPSAKFDPEGVAGIINVIMKKNKLEGISGIVSTNVSNNGSYGGEAMLSYRNHKYAAILSADYNNREFSGERTMERIMTRGDGSTFTTNSEGGMSFGRDPYSIRGGIEYYPSDMDVVSFTTTFGNRNRDRDSEMMYEEMSSIDNIKTEYLSTDKSSRGGDYLGLSMDYQHKFNNDGHEILGQVNFNTRDGEDVDLNYMEDINEIITEGRKSTESGPSNDLRIKMDYTWPINKTDKFEAGIQTQFNTSEEENDVYYYNILSGEYDFQDLFSHVANYDKNIHSVYSIYSTARGRLGLQAGLRGEYTDRLVELIGEDESYSIERFDLFPSAHMSWQQAEKTQFMGSYTRRIHRPRGHYMEPFVTWRDAYTVQQGNPDIEPEYIDSYEMAFLQYFGNKNMLSMEAYHRKTNNKIERVQSVYEDYEDVIMRTVANVGEDYTFGMEFMLRMNMTKWWTFNLMGNLYDYRIEGEYDEVYFNNSSYNWNMRFNSDFKLKTGTTLQVNSMYNSPTVTAQGERDGSYMVNAAIKQNFMKNKLTATIQVRDIFGTGTREHTTDTVNLYSYHRMEREAPIISLNLRFNFNNFKEKKSRNGSNGNGMDMDDEI